MQGIFPAIPMQSGGGLLGEFDDLAFYRLPLQPMDD
jgi:hypothetical protein